MDPVARATREHDARMAVGRAVVASRAWLIRGNEVAAACAASRQNLGSDASGDFYVNSVPPEKASVQVCKLKALQLPAKIKT